MPTIAIRRPRVLLVDTTQYHPSSPLFAEALERASTDGGAVGEFVDEARAFGESKSFVRRVAARLSPWTPQSTIELHRDIVARARASRPDIVLVVKGAHLTETCLAALKATGA